MVLGLDMRFLGRKWQKKNVKGENKGKNSIASAKRSLARVGSGGRNRILVLNDVALGRGEEGWVGIALVEFFDFGGGSASPGVVLDRHHGEVEIS